MMSPRAAHRTLDDHSRLMKLGMKLFLFPEYHRFRRLFLQAAGIRSGERILDFGCGVGLLEEFLIGRPHSGLNVIGADIGENLLRQAVKTFQRPDCLFVRVSETGQLPFADQSFDLIVTSLVVHLLSPAQKQRVFAEFHRILRPDGRLIMAEFGPPTSWYGRWTVFLSEHFWQKLWPYEKHSRESYRGQIPVYLTEAGFLVKNVSHVKGIIDILESRKRPFPPDPFAKASECHD